MRILVILPNWLGDAVMASAAIEALTTCNASVRFSFVGSALSIAAMQHHPLCERAIVDETKKGGNRLRNTYALAKQLGVHDLAVSFRDQIHATLLLFWSGSKRTFVRSSWHARMLCSDALSLDRSEHLVVQYLHLAYAAGAAASDHPKLKVYIAPHRYERPTLGINPGATYGSAKRWYPQKFAEVAAHFAPRFEIVIFGSPAERSVAEEIEAHLTALHVSHVTNLAGRTDVAQMCAYVGGLSLLITNDSGPMHVAAAYGVPTVAIFGPTRHRETSQWANPQSAIVRHELKCAPCMKRECPLKHHDCMRLIEAHEVTAAALKLLEKA
ncbi:MAG: lipopolysaccharide heptosyltransferase II [Campylobacterales bacterium]|nr:lipopolysaccharide heptosyltransferase II [Campylobacterales bacterium]